MELLSTQPEDAALAAQPGPQRTLLRLQRWMRGSPVGAVLLSLTGLAGLGGVLGYLLRTPQVHQELLGDEAPNPWYWTGFVLLLLVGVLPGYVVYPSGQVRLLFTAAIASALVIPVAAFLEASDRLPAVDGPGTFLRYVLLLLLGSVALLADWTTLNRYLSWRRAGGRPEVPEDPAAQTDEPGVPAEGVPDGDVAAWARSTVLPGMQPGTRSTGGYPDAAVEERFGERGVAVSGGGIRSATFALGGLNALRDHGELGRADVLASVSGGGYLTGALRMAVQKDPDPADDEQQVTEPFEPFADGSPETAHLRRHGRYLADGLGEWVVGLLVLARGVLATIGLLVLGILVTGQLLGYTGRAVHRSGPGGEAAEHARGGRSVPGQRPGRLRRPHRGGGGGSRGDVAAGRAAVAGRGLAAQPQPARLVRRGRRLGRRGGDRGGGGAVLRPAAARGRLAQPAPAGRARGRVRDRSAGGPGRGTGQHLHLRHRAGGGGATPAGGAAVDRRHARLEGRRAEEGHRDGGQARLRPPLAGDPGRGRSGRGGRGAARPARPDRAERGVHRSCVPARAAGLGAPRRLAGRLADGPAVDRDRGPRRGPGPLRRAPRPDQPRTAPLLPPPDGHRVRGPPDPAGRGAGRQGVPGQRGDVAARVCEEGRRAAPDRALRSRPHLGPPSWPRPGAWRSRSPSTARGSAARSSAGTRPTRRRSRHRLGPRTRPGRGQAFPELYQQDLTLQVRDGPLRRRRSPRRWAARAPR